MWLQNLAQTKLLAWFAKFLQDPDNLRYGAIALATVLGGRYLTKIIRSTMVKRHLSAKRKEKLLKSQNALKQLESDVAGTLSSSEQEETVNLNLSELTAKLQAGKVSPTQVLRAYQCKALEVHKQLNCLIEPITEASEQANAVEKSKVKGPLYGVPVSLKDNYGLKGYDSTVGCAKLINSPYAEDAVLVQVLKMQGAIPFVKTNIPQTMISWETTNPIFGMTRNPHDNSRGVGGSSGGEAALIGGGGSVLGFGSDIGGSLRIPANMCGICGLKPTDLRISNKGMTPVLKGQTCLISAYGPLARDVDSLVTAMKAVCIPEMSLLDPLVPYKPFDTEVFESKRKLKIGFYLQDGFFHAVPAMERAVLEAKEILENHGHEVIEWDYPNKGLKAVLSFGKAISGDGGKEICGLVQGDATDSAIKNIATLLLLPNSVKKLIIYIISLIYPDIGRVLRASTELHTVSDWWKFIRSTQKFRESVHEDWRSKGLDAVICPGFACPALPVNYAAFASGTISYTALYNVLNFPAGSLPVTKVTAEDVEKMKDYPVKDLWHRTVKKGMKGSEGLPVNVQVAALPWQEEMVLRVMKEIENGVRK